MPATDSLLVAIEKALVTDLTTAAASFETTGWTPTRPGVPDYKVDSDSGLKVQVVGRTWSNESDDLNGTRLQIHTQDIFVLEKCGNDVAKRDTLLRLCEEIVDRYEEFVSVGGYRVHHCEPDQDAAYVSEELRDSRMFVGVIEVQFVVNR